MTQHPDLPPDPQTQRTRWELWAIFVIVAVVVVASLAWRTLGHHPPKPELDRMGTEPIGGQASPVGAAAGAPPHPAPSGP